MFRSTYASSVRIWRVFDESIAEWHATSKVCMLFTSEGFVTRAFERLFQFDLEKVRTIQAEYQHRDFYLATAETSIAIPFVLLCLVLFTSLARDPKKFWALGGAVAALLLSATVDLIACWVGGLNRFEVLRTCNVYVIMGAMGGIALSSRFSKASPCSAAAEDDSLLEDAQSCTTTEQVGKSGNGVSKQTPAENLRDPAMTATFIIFMLFNSVCMVAPATSAVIPLLATPATEWTTGTTVKLALMSLAVGTLAAVYIFFSFLYIRCTTRLLRETTFGTVLAVASMVILRSTTPFTSWPSWAIDAVLAFVIFNVGLLVGHGSHVRTMGFGLPLSSTSTPFVSKS